MLSITDDVVIHQQPTVGTTSSLPLQIIIDTTNDPDHPVFEVSNPNGSSAMSIDGNGQISATNVYASNLGTASALASDADAILAANSDSRIATQKATKTYVDTGAALKLAKASNLSDLTSASTARSNLGLGTLATQSGTFSGTSSGTNTGDQDLSGLAVKANNLSDLTSASAARTNLGLNTITDGTGALMLKSMGFLSVAIDITNNGGVIQHMIYDAAGSSSTSNFAGSITGATAAATNTPSVNSVTGFTSGAGIDASGANRFVLNTGTFVNADTAVKAQIEFNSTTSAIRVQIRPISLNINGTTKNRLALGFTLEAGGGAFNLNTTNIAAGQIVRVRLFGFCPS